MAGERDDMDVSNFVTTWTSDNPPYVILKWSVQNFSSAEKLLKSPTFDISNISKWNLLLHPKYVKDGDNFVKISLKRNSGAECTRHMLKGELSVHGPSCELIFDKIFEEVYDPAVNDSIEFLVAKECFLLRPCDVSNVMTGYAFDTYLVRCEMVVSHEINTVNECRPYLEKLSLDLRRIYDDSMFTDVRIRCADDIIHAHKAVLHARSTLFAQNLNVNVNYLTEKEEKNPYIAAVLLFVYTGNPDMLLSAVPLEMFGTVAKVAKNWELKELVNVLTPLKMHCRTCIRQENFQYTWEVKNFSSLRAEGTDVIYSSEFFTKEETGTRWKLTLEKNCQGERETYGVFLVKVKADSSSHKANVEFRVYNKKSKSSITRRREYVFGPRSNHKCGISALFTRHFVQSDSTNDDTLEIVCILKIHLDTESWVDFKATSIDISDKSSYLLKYLKMLSQHFKKLYEEKKYCDLNISVGNAIIKVHRAIMWARSSYFSNILSRRPEEHITVPVEVDILKDLLSYMYSGELPRFSLLNMQKIYVASDLLKLREVWSACRLFVLCHITVDNVLEVMVMAHEQGDTELEKAAEMFASTRGNAKLIIVTTRWKRFCSNYNKFAMRIYHNLAMSYCF